ncbi:MAG: hypothetical protein K6F17_01715 [Lachnospiraceae bacterium]|nr:hypothetical protein [Lachnospiraceae bacterium]
MKVISMMMGTIEVAKIEDGKFTNIVKNSSGLIPSFIQLYDDCFYGIPHSNTFEERYSLVTKNNYFCYTKPTLKLIAKEF